MLSEIDRIVLVSNLLNRNILPIFRRRDARQNEEEEDAARDGGGDREAEENPEGGGGATTEAGEAEGSAAAAAVAEGRPVITVRVTQDAETGRRTFNIRQVLRPKMNCT